MGQCFSSSFWPLRCFGFSLYHDSRDDDQTSTPGSSSTPLNKQSHMSRFSSSSCHHDSGDKDQNSRPGSSFSALPKQDYVSHFSGSSRHHDGGDRDQTSRPGSSSTPPFTQNYEVFLSFRGDETRCGFTDHLYHRLDDKGIIVFRDNEGLLVGEKINQLLEAIKASQISVPIISPDYASSKWCLQELLQIVECNKTSGQLVLPIFYKVKPADVREQKGVFGENFRLSKEKNNLDEKFVQDLQDAFKRVTALKGWELDKIADGHEGALVKIVVRRIFNELRKPILSVPDFLVGVDEHIEAIKKKFDDVPSNDAKIIVIHGMGGIGKTTLAKALYNDICESFECQSFVPDIREASSIHKGMEGLQKQMIRDILVDKSLSEISHVDEGRTTIEKRFKDKRLLLLLDDVKDKDQLDKLAAKNNWFGPESIVIVTTRNKNVGEAPAVNLSHELNELNYDQSYQLFCKHAFGPGASCLRDPETIAGDIVSRTGGLPLAIEVIGSLLRGKGKSVWRDTEEKLRRMPNSTVHEKLRISYDALDYVQQQIFLDIACLMPIDEYDPTTDFEFSTYMWKACDFYPHQGIDALVSLSLIKVFDGDHVVMHDQLKDLGREIVRSEDCNEIGKRSRIWLRKEAIEVIEGKQGTRKIQALKLEGYNCKSEQFEGMDNLRFLRLFEGDLIGDFENLFPNLRWLCWWGSFSERGGDIMGINFNPKNKKLVILDLESSNITQDWDGWSQMKDLKVINIDRCNKLIECPDLSALNGLEVLRLRHCRSLRRIHPSIGRHSKTLRTLSVFCCDELFEIPMEFGKMEELRYLDIGMTCMTYIPIFDGYMQKLRTLSARHCFVLTSIPESIGTLKLLTELDLSHTKVTKLPDSIGNLYNLTKLLINHTPIKCFPTSFGKLSKLGELDLEGCRELESLSNLPCNLSSLKFQGDSMETLIDISNLTILKHLTYWDSFEKGNKVLNVGKLNQLESLMIRPSQYKNLDADDSHKEVSNNWDDDDSDEEVSASQEIDADASDEEVSNNWDDDDSDEEVSASQEEIHADDSDEDVSNNWDDDDSDEEVSGSREEIEISNPAKEMDMAPENFTLLPELPSSLVELEVYKCQTLRTLSSLSNLKDLSRINLKDCPGLEEIDILEGAESLVHLNIEGCGKLSRLGNVSNLKNLSRLDLKDCFELMEINILEGAESLTHLRIERCRKLSRLGDVSNLKNLSSLDLKDCSELMEINILEGAESLKDLKIKGCGNLSRIGDLSNLKMLRVLSLDGYGKPSDVEGIEKLTSLTDLHISGCNPNINIPDLSMLRNLKYLEITDAELMEIPWLQELESLKTLHISSKSLQYLPDLSHLTELWRLDISDCQKLREIRGIENMKSLRSLSIKGCTALRKLPDLPNVNIEFDDSDDGQDE